MRRPITMKMRAQLRVVLPLLMALLYRAAIPAGFMPMVDADGRLAIEFCPGVEGVPSLAGHEHHHHMDGHVGGRGGDKGGGAHSVCPFAASAGSAPLPNKVWPVAVAQAHSDLRASVPASISSPTILRSQQSRAPPPSGLA